jgi:expansin (peptidoglycan-binding protein)
MRNLGLLLLVISACASPACGNGGSTTYAATGGSANATSTNGTTAANGPTVAATTGTSLTLYGMPYNGGQYNLGPVDYSETQFHNACAPGTKYAPQVQSAEGMLLAGLWDGIPNVAGYCDACIYATTPTGHSSMMRVVTYGQTSTNSIDTSQDAFTALNTGEYPRTVTWQFAKCPDTGAMMYEFQTGSNAYWTSLWVRNARVPLAKVEVQSANHSSFIELQRGTDGTLTDGSGFGMGPFQIRSTGIDGQTVVESFNWPANGIAGAFLTGQSNFK